MPDFTFFGDVKTSDEEFFFLFLNLTVLNKKSAQGKFAYNLSYIFSELENDTVAVVGAKA